MHILQWIYILPEDAFVLLMYSVGTIFQASGLHTAFANQAEESQRAGSICISFVIAFVFVFAKYFHFKFICICAFIFSRWVDCRKPLLIRQKTAKEQDPFVFPFLIAFVIAFVFVFEMYLYLQFICICVFLFSKQMDCRQPLVIRQKKGKE